MTYSGDSIPRRAAIPAPLRVVCPTISRNPAARPALLHPVPPYLPQVTGSQVQGRRGVAGPERSLSAAWSCRRDAWLWSARPAAPRTSSESGTARRKLLSAAPEAPHCRRRRPGASRRAHCIRRESRTRCMTTTAWWGQEMSPGCDWRHSRKTRR